MDQAKHLLNSLKTNINSAIEGNSMTRSLVDPVYERVKIDKAYIFLVEALLPIVIICTLGFGNFIVDLIAFVYPLYMSLKAIESSDKDDDTAMLTYWLMFSFIKVFESMFGWLTAIIPFYFIFKIALCIWCYHPKSLGANTLYHRIVKPFIVPKMNEILGVTSSSGANTDSSTSASAEATRDLTVLISSVLLSHDYKDVMCELSIERGEEKKSQDTSGIKYYNTKHMDGKDLHYNFSVKLSAVTEESFNNDWLHISIKTDPTFDNASEKKTLGEVKYKLSKIDDLQAENGDFTLNDIVEVRGKITKSK